MQLTPEFKQQVLEALQQARVLFGGSDAAFAKTLGISGSQYSRLKNGQVDGQLSEGNWIAIGRHLQVSPRENTWQVARTAVYTEMESNLRMIKELSKSMILVDECGIGKTFCAKHIIKTMPNAFYVDCSQGKGKRAFIKLLCRSVGLETIGRLEDMLANLKYTLTLLDKPLIVLDEAGDLEYDAFLLLKEIWNATEGAAAYYLMGAGGLRRKIEKGREAQKVGYDEIFSRFSDEFIKLVPATDDSRRAFIAQLVGDVAAANLVDTSKIDPLIKKCLAKNTTLRHLETLIKVNQAS